MFLRSEAYKRIPVCSMKSFLCTVKMLTISYRLKKQVTTITTFLELKIIHYKGKAPKKENLNTVVNFYRAMLIFVRKHFSNGSMKGFTHFIQAAIFLSAGIYSL
ncbi:MAG: hypothetical protein MZU84_08010 [Sphingobacterium sp.]|nr:hypothetical protein [Sphingobacterium sp.]